MSLHTPLLSQTSINLLKMAYATSLPDAVAMRDAPQRTPRSISSSPPHCCCAVPHTTSDDLLSAKLARQQSGGSTKTREIRDSLAVFASVTIKRPVTQKAHRPAAIANRVVRRPTTHAARQQRAVRLAQEEWARGRTILEEKSARGAVQRRAMKVSTTTSRRFDAANRSSLHLFQHAHARAGRGALPPTLATAILSATHQSPRLFKPLLRRAIPHRVPLAPLAKQADMALLFPPLAGQANIALLFPSLPDEAETALPFPFAQGPVRAPRKSALTALRTSYDECAPRWPPRRVPETGSLAHRPPLTIMQKIDAPRVLAAARRMSKAFKAGRRVKQRKRKTKQSRSGLIRKIRERRVRPYKSSPLAKGSVSN